MLFRRAQFFGAVLGLCLAPLSVFAEDLSCPVPPADPLVKLLSPPPCDTCAETKAELEELQTLQRNRSEGEAKHALDDYDISLARFLDGADIKYDASALGKCKAFFDEVAAKTKEAAEHGKSQFCRTRPFALPNSGLKPLQITKNSPSYPSGHTTYGTTIAAVLGQMVPEKREALYARAADYGHSRMVAGVHFRSDVEAGKVLGMAVAANEFANDNDFKTAFPDAMKCVRDALGLATAPCLSGACPAHTTNASRP